MNLLIKCVLSIYLFLLTDTISAKRGPHHPMGQKTRPKDSHFEAEREHILEDLNSWPLDTKNIENMTEDEKNFYYFKIHDTDHNDVLDGLEMLQAATHHKHSTIHGIKGSNEHDKELMDIKDELSHITDIIDDFIKYADLNNDGYLNYPEYTNAISSPEESDDYNDNNLHNKPEV